MTLLSTRLTIRTVRAEMWVVRVVTSLAMCSSARSLWTAFCTFKWKVELRTLLVVVQLATVCVTAIILLSRRDSVARPASPKRRTTLSSTETRMRTIWSWTVLSSQAGEEDWVDRVLEASPSSDTGLLAKTSNMSSSTAVGNVPVTSFIAICTDYGAISTFQIRVMVLDEVATLRPLRNMRFGLVITVALSSCSRALDSIIQKMSNRQNLTKR